eukprot:3336631-Rhodomonas_salina.5
MFGEIGPDLTPYVAKSGWPETSYEEYRKVRVDARRKSCCSTTRTADSEIQTHAHAPPRKQTRDNAFLAPIAQGLCVLASDFAVQCPTCTVSQRSRPASARRDNISEGKGVI